MILRRTVSPLFLLLASPMALWFAGCSALHSISILPASGSVVLTAVGQTAQYSAFGQKQVGSGLPTTDNITSSVIWTSGNSAVATINSAGLATAVGAGHTTITAESNGITASSDLTVNISGAGGTTGSTQEALLAINIVPGSTTVSNKGMTGQYLAFGTFSSAPTVRDLTNQVTWISLAPEVVSVSSGGVAGEIGGLATAQGYTGDSVIYAEASNPDGTVVLSNPQTFTCKDAVTQVCNQPVAHPQFATLTVFSAGSNSTTWLVTAPSGTGVPNLIHCGPGSTTGGSVCTGTYETGSTVTLTESPTGTGFGGWSSGDGSPGIGCITAPGTTLLTSPTCTVTLTGNTSVGAIFY